MRAHTNALDNVVLVERTDRMVVFFFREQSHEWAFRVRSGQAPVADLEPGFYRIRRFLTTDPAVDLGELFLEIGPCVETAPLRLRSNGLPE